MKGVPKKEPFSYEKISTGIWIIYPHNACFKVEGFSGFSEGSFVALLEFLWHLLGPLTYGTL